MRDLSNNLHPVEAIEPDDYTNDNTPVAIDLAGYQSCMLVIHVGDAGVGFNDTDKIVFKLTHSEDDLSYEAVTDDDVLGADVDTGGVILALDEEYLTPDVYKFGYIGDRRYLKLLADFGGTHGSATPLSAVAILGSAASRPIA